MLASSNWSATLLWLHIFFAITATTSSSPSSSLQIEAPSRDNDEVGDGVDVVGEENGAVNEELASVATTPILFQQPQQRTTAAAARKKSPLLFTASAPDTTNNNDDDDANSNGNMATIGVDDHGGDEDEESQYRKWKATGREVLSSNAATRNDQNPYDIDVNSDDGGGGGAGGKREEKEATAAATKVIMKLEPSDWWAGVAEKAAQKAQQEQPAAAGQQQDGDGDGDTLVKSNDAEGTQQQQEMMATMAGNRLNDASLSPPHRSSSSSSFPSSSMGKATSALKAALQKGVGGGGGKRKSPIRPQLSRTHAHHWEGKGAGGTPSTYSTASERYTDGEELVAGSRRLPTTADEGGVGGGEPPPKSHHELGGYSKFSSSTSPSSTLHHVTKRPTSTAAAASHGGGGGTQTYHPRKPQQYLPPPIQPVVGVVKATAAGGGSPAGMASQLAPYTGKKIAQQTQAAASAPPTFRLFPDFLGDSQQPLQPSDPGPLDEGGGGGSGVRFAPPQFPLLGTGQQAPLNFDLFSNGAAATGGGGGVAANGLNGLANGFNLNQMASALGLLGNGGGGSPTAAGAMAGGGAAHAAPMLNPLQLLGQSGSTVEQITNMAKNLLSMAQSGGGGAGGNNEMISALTKALAGGGAADASKFSSTAVQHQGIGQAAVGGANSIADTFLKATDEKTNRSEGVGVGDQDPTLLFSRSGSDPSSKQDNTNPYSNNNNTLASVTLGAAAAAAPFSNETLKVLSGLPTEQRNLLEAALRNGELDRMALEKTNGSLFLAGGPEGQQKKPVNSESRLMEWIQQNRPRSPDVFQRGGGGPGSGGGIGGGVMNNGAGLSTSEKIPYYGRYCGSFFEHQPALKHIGDAHGIAGAVWAVDERRLLIMQFAYQPGQQHENVTFWAGPTRPFGSMVGASPQDFVPVEETGFYLRPEHLDPKAVFMPVGLQVERRVAKSRFPLPPQTPAPAAAPPPVVLAKSPPLTTAKNANTSPSKNNGTKEKDEEEDDRTAAIFAEIEGGSDSSPSPSPSPPTFTGFNNDLLKMRVMKHRRRRRRQIPPPPPSPPTPTTPSAPPMGQPPMKKSVYSQLYEGSGGGAARIHLGGGEVGATSNDKLISDGYTQLTTSTLSPTAAVPFLPVQHNEPQRQPTVNQSSSTLHNEMAVEPEGSQLVPHSKGGGAESLRWYAGYQPILLPLPEGRRVTSLGWLSVFDHQIRQSLATVTIPNGVPIFQVPSIIQLRSFVPNGGVQVKSGPIVVLDMKTVQIQDFSLTTTNTSLWFMVGREVLPSPSGFIVPILDRESNTYSCDSLRDYHSETVTLQLPGSLDWTDGIFWFAVYALPQRVSWSHLHLPYRELNLPPHLSTSIAPQCIFSPSESGPPSDHSAAAPKL